MNKAKSSVLQALSRRAAQPRGGRSGPARFDLILPSGWPESNEPLRWQVSASEPRGGEAPSLDRLPPEVARLPLVVWTPAAETILTSVTLPTRSRRKIALALPFALEDRLVGDPENLHYAWQPEQDGSLSVAITARARMQQWMEQLKQAGLTPVSLCPATLLIPWSLDGWTGAFVGTELLVRSGPLRGFVCPADATPPTLLLAALQEARGQTTAPDSLTLFDAPRTLSTDVWGKVLGLTVRTESGSFWSHRTETAAPINLLQGLYERKQGFSEPLRAYRVAIILLGVWLLSALSYNALEWWRLRGEHDALVKQMSTILLTTFPETKTVLDPAAQMQKGADQLLSRRGSGDRGLVPLLAKSAAALRADPRVRLRGLRFAEQALTLELTWPAAVSVDTARSALESAGLRVEVQATTPRGESMDGRLRVQAGDKPVKKGT